MTEKAMIDVELVADRVNHKDLMYGTEVVWLHKGDIRKVPAALWPRFATHADVYKLAHPVTAAENDRQAALKVAAVASDNLDQALKAQKPLPIVAAPQEGHKPTYVTAAQLEPLPDDKIREEGEARGYRLHPQLSPANLRTRFLAAQETDPNVPKPATVPA